MQLSSIAKHSRGGSGSALSLAIGDEIRRRRLSRGLSQAQIGGPMTRAFVSAVENGRSVPSVPALALITDRLGIPLDEFFSGVHSRMTRVYNPGHEDHEDPSARRRR